MDEVGEIASIVQDHVQGLAIGEDEGLLDAPHVLLVRLTLPRVDWNTHCRNGCSGVVLRGQDYDQTSFTMVKKCGKDNNYKDSFRS